LTWDRETSTNVRSLVKSWIGMELEGAIAAEAAGLVETARRLVSDFPPAQVPQGALLGAWFDAGLTWVHFPEGLGGRGCSRQCQPIVDDVMLEAGGTLTRQVGTIGYGIAAPTLVAFGSRELTDRLLRPLAAGEETWCQLFSEPGAGSDLANVSASATLADGKWTVNGQKVWSSRAHEARWGVLLARTDPSLPKHQGLTYFVIDMHQPGVEIRPLRQMTGRAEFNEVFLTEAMVPDAQRLGAVGEGWRVARTTLLNERMAIGSRKSSAGAPSAMADALRLWSDRPERRTPVLRDRLAALWIRAQAHRLTCERFSAAAALGQEAVIAKLVSAELRQAAYEFSMDLLGPEASTYGTYDMAGSNQDGTELQEKFLRSRANTIEGGSSEIIRNIIGERILGLPAEHQPDRGKPWREGHRG
jgi:alkylation response protein AidB-like acyl-CoA dehydrogenase